MRLEQSGGFRSREINRIQQLIQKNQRYCWSDGMNTLTTELRETVAEKVTVTKDTLEFELADGRTMAAPLAWYPRLLHGTARERANWRLIGNGEGIHWPDLDEDISVENVLLGHSSGENQRSFKRWLEARQSRNR